MRYCKNCGLLAPYDAANCPQCGAPLPPAPQPATQAESAPRPAECEESAPSMTTGQTFWYLLLFSIPIAGVILMLIFGFAVHENPARRTLARAYLLRTAVFWCAAAALAVLGVFGFVNAFSRSFPYYYFG